MIGPDCDDEYEGGRPVTVALVTALGALLAAVAPVVLRRRYSDEDARRELERRIARLEAAAESSEGDDE